MLSRTHPSFLFPIWHSRFYLEKSIAIFESNQADLEFAVEGLSELCEKPVEIIQEQNLKQVIPNKAVYVKQRQGVLLEDTAKGLMEGRWGFNVYAKNWYGFNVPAGVMMMSKWGSMNRVFVVVVHELGNGASFGFA